MCIRDRYYQVLYYIKKRYHRRSRCNVAQMHGTIREDRTSPVIGWSATCDREFTIVVHIHIVMSYGSSHMDAMLNTKQT